MKTKELRQQSVGELKAELLAVSRELFSLRMQRGSGQLTQHHLMTTARRTIARIKTLLTEKAKAGEQ